MPDSGESDDFRRSPARGLGGPVRPVRGKAIVAYLAADRSFVGALPSHLLRLFTMAPEPTEPS